MWILLGFAAMITAILSIARTISHRDAKWYRFTSLSFTALTMCAEYRLVNKWVLEEDWSALMDVVPTMERFLWFFVVSAVVINGISLFRETRTAI